MTAAEARKAMEGSIANSVSAILRHSSFTMDDDYKREAVRVVCNALATWSFSTGHQLGYAEGWNDHKKGKDKRKRAHTNSAKDKK